MTSQGEDMAAEVGVTQRLRWVKYKRDDYEVKVEKELYWPSLYYDSHKDAAEHGDDDGFQEEVAHALLDNFLEEAQDLGPVCRLLGLDGGSYYCVEQEEDVLIFYKNVPHKRVVSNTKEEYFDLSKPEEQDLWGCYQAALQEAIGLLGKASKKRKRLGRRKSNAKLIRLNVDDDSNNGGGGGNNDDNSGNDKPDAAAKVSFQVVQSSVATAAPANSVTTAPGTNTEATLAVANQETSKEVEVESATAEAAPQPQQVAVSKKAKMTKESPPITPPFHTREMQGTSPTAPWAQIWREMRYVGWVKRTEDGQETFSKPGRSVQGGVVGVDYFTSLNAVQAYVQSQIPHWRPPAWVAADEVPAAQPEAPANPRAISSSATVITNECSMPSPQAPRERPRRAAATADYSSQPSLFDYKRMDKLWWKKQDVPTLAQVKPLLLKLGIRVGEDGNFKMPKPVERSATLQLPPLDSADTLRKFLCTKGVPSVPTGSLLDKNEKEMLDNWVSFAYVPIAELDLQEVSLPKDYKVVALLTSKFHFETANGCYFPPLMDRLSTAKRDERKKGVHFYQGLDEVRKYIRSTACFTWTEDLLASSEEEDEYHPHEKALLRLWAASSPADLPTYVTNRAEIQQMETILPQDQNVFGCEDEEDDDAMEATSEEEESDNDNASNDESTEESASEAEASEESEVEQEVNSESDGETSSVQSSEASESSSDAASSPESQPAPSKRKLTYNPNPQKRRKRETLPWWQTKGPPSFAKVKPILKKLRITQARSGVFLLPGKESMTEIDSPESLRKHLCYHGLPKFAKNDAMKPAVLPNEEEKTILRQWISFAPFPASGTDFREAVSQALPEFEKHFAKRSEVHVLNFLYSFGFQKNVNGIGFFPPGIDRLGRSQKTRGEHVLADLSAVRTWVRSSEKMELEIDDTESESDADTQATETPSAKLLAVRLWAALGTEPLPTYDVAVVKEATSVPLNQQAKGRKKKGIRRVEEPPLDLPRWWSESQTRLYDLLEDEKEKKKKIVKNERSRYTPHMTVEHLDLACVSRAKIIETVRSSLEFSTSIDSVIADICKDEVSQLEVQYFLSGDEKHMVRQARHTAIAQVLKARLRLPVEDSTRSTESEEDDDDSSKKSSSSIARSSEKIAPTNSRKGSLVECEVDLSQKVLPVMALNRGAVIETLQRRKDDMEESAESTPVDIEGSLGKEGGEASTTAAAVDDTKSVITKLKDTDSSLVDEEKGEVVEKKVVDPARENQNESAGDPAKARVEDAGELEKAAVVATEDVASPLEADQEDIQCSKAMGKDKALDSRVAAESVDTKEVGEDRSVGTPEESFANKEVGDALGDSVEAKPSSELKQTDPAGDTLNASALCDQPPAAVDNVQPVPMAEGNKDVQEQAPAPTDNVQTVQMAEGNEDLKEEEDACVAASEQAEKHSGHDGFHLQLPDFYVDEQPESPAGGPNECRPEEPIYDATVARIESPGTHLNEFLFTQQEESQETSQELDEMSAAQLSNPGCVFGNDYDELEDDCVPSSNPHGRRVTADLPFPPLTQPGADDY